MCLGTCWVNERVNSKLWLVAYMMKEEQAVISLGLYGWILLLLSALVMGIGVHIPAPQAYLCGFWKGCYHSCYDFICILLIAKSLGRLSLSGTTQVLLPVFITGSPQRHWVQQNCRDQSWAAVINSCIFSFGSCPSLAEESLLALSTAG